MAEKAERLAFGLRDDVCVSVTMRTWEQLQAFLDEFAGLANVTIDEADPALFASFRADARRLRRQINTFGNRRR